MTLRRTEQGGSASNPDYLGDFVGNLLSNIPWKERLESEEWLQLKRPAGGGALELEVQIPQKWNRHGLANLWIRLPRDLSIELSARNGRIDIEGVRSRVHARSQNGSVIIRDVIGNINVSTSNAKISCSDTYGQMVARSRDGKIELEKHRGSVDASTSNGLIDADLDIRVDNGTIRNDLPLGKCTRETSSRILGQVGAGGAPIKLRTSNGSIDLR